MTKKREIGYCESCARLHATTVIHDLRTLAVLEGYWYLKRVLYHLNRLPDAGDYNRD